MKKGENWFILSAFYSVILYNQWLSCYCLPVLGLVAELSLYRKLRKSITFEINAPNVHWQSILDRGISLTRSPNPGLISKHWKCWWTVPMYAESFLLFITKRNKFKELELTQKPLKWNIYWVNLDIRACIKMLVWAAD